MVRCSRRLHLNFFFGVGLLMGRFGFVGIEEGGDYCFFSSLFLWMDVFLFSGGDLLLGCASRGRI